MTEQFFDKNRMLVQCLDTVKISKEVFVQTFLESIK